MENYLGLKGLGRNSPDVIRGETSVGTWGEAYVQPIEHDLGVSSASGMAKC